RLRRFAYALRRADSMGPVLHDFGMARGYVGGARQLWLRLRAGQAGIPRALDADDDAHGSDPLRVYEGRDEVGLGDDSAIPRLARPHGQGRQRDSVSADLVDADLRDGTRRGQDAARDGRRAHRDAPTAGRGNGRRARGILGAAARAGFDAGRLRW